MTSMKISTESLAAILDGGISFSTPDKEEMGSAVEDGHRFSLHADPDDKWLNWSPALQLGEIPGQDLKEKKEPKNKNELENYLTHTPCLSAPLGSRLQFPGTGV